jgi:hypothetical protein
LLHCRSAMACKLSASKRPCSMCSRPCSMCKPTVCVLCVLVTPADPAVVAGVQAMARTSLA